MKKLFSAMMAATMVAGTAVTAFAATANTAVTDNKGFDFALTGAYTDEGGKLEVTGKKNKIDGGDKLYFPILVSGEELLDQKDNATDDAGTGVTSKQMYFATKASEVKDLKASVKDEVGGKYIDDAAIVKKDINIKKDGETVVAPVKGEKEEIKVTVKNTWTANATTGASDVTLALTVGGEEIITDTMADNADMSTAAKIAAAFDGKSSASYEVTDVTGDVITIKAKADGDKTTTATEVAKIKAKAGTNKPTIAGSDNAYAVVNEGVDEVTGTSSSDMLAKVYCVEVKMADYFKAEETEVEFNIKLKDGGRVAFDTEDDKLAYFNGTFDLGKDTETLSAHPSKKTAVKGVEVKKFKKGEIEILIGKDTRSVQLDEAFESDGTTKEDITNIYIENDKTIDDTFTFDVKASSQDDLYLELNQDAVKDLAVSNQKADLTFFNFPGNPEFDFSGTATFAVEDEDEDYFFYEIVDGELVETNAKYNDDDAVFELRTNKLTSYVISDKKLETAEEKEEANDEEKKDEEATGGEATDAVTPNPNGGKGNANTGAADLIGVASALAVVSVAAAGAVALKK